MSKTLYVGIYDYPYCYKAYEFINNEFVEIDISENDRQAIYDYTYNTNRLEYYNRLSDKIKQYDNIIVCDDTNYSLIDLENCKKEMATALQNFTDEDLEKELLRRKKQ